MSRLFLALSAALLCLGFDAASAQLQPPSSAYESPIDTALPDFALQAAADDERPGASTVTPTGLKLRNAGVIGLGALGVVAYGLNNWWEDGFTGKFRTVNEGWLGQNTYAGGADKFGHAFFNYAGTRLLTRGFQLMGNPPRESLSLAFWSTLGVMTAVEVVDGYSKKYRFSPQDAVMNLLGASFGYLMERHPEIDRLLDFRMLYKPSEGNAFEPAGDYSGQTYLFVLKASGIPALRAYEPARYIEFALGYGSRGYENPASTDRSRNVYFGVSLNLSEVLAQTVFRGQHERGAVQQGADMFLELFQVPGTTALARHRM